MGLLTGYESCQLVRLRDRHAADLSCGHLGEDEFVVFQRPAEDCSRVALRGRRCSSPGRDGVASLERSKRSREGDAHAGRLEKSQRDSLAAYGWRADPPALPTI